MRSFVYRLGAGDNNAYCLLFWIITGFLFLLAMFVTITGKSVFQPYKQAQEELATAQKFEEKLANFRAEKGFKTNKELGIETQQQPVRRNWIAILLFSGASLAGVIMFFLRKRRIGVILLVAGVLGLIIILLSFWRYGALCLWGVFGLSFFLSLIYTPFAFRDEVEELYERARRQQVRAQINPQRPPESGAPEGGATGSVAPKPLSQGRWWARILSMDLLAEFISGFVRRIFRFGR